MRKVEEKESLNEGRRIEGASNCSTSYNLQSLLKDGEERRRAVAAIAGGIQSQQQKRRVRGQEKGVLDRK
ncbi:hypothetical protein MRB53_028193 [Persea americana]|uniref:Uncharacterized protein n=1 Tax=Persea americana TaxID=3435 RepID=A0ACC2KFD2_PERAE|nr:hypothetical protein MRB53_028193 [Persea americana]